ncbi:hypothetical protein [Adhaeribacter aquaticus]|uniref:hypothetical protein n=1 Tax=Adhaeribacter aquaticus TaxID=299567 RepID=UPI000414B4D5|nr:hypothetical protein [Adhaeribacter aquaticus]
MFNQLPAGSQVSLLSKQGIALAQREHKGYVITLYALNNYFVELWKKHDFEIIGTFHKSVNSMAILEPYMDSIDLQNFLK